MHRDVLTRATGYTVSFDAFTITITITITINRPSDAARSRLCVLEIHNGPRCVSQKGGLAQTIPCERMRSVNYWLNPKTVQSLPPRL